MREKVSNVDYRYMTEPNILNISIVDVFIIESIDVYSIDFKKIDNYLKNLVQSYIYNQHVMHLLSRIRLRYLRE